MTFVGMGIGVKITIKNKIIIWFSFKKAYIKKYNYLKLLYTEIYANAQFLSLNFVERVVILLNCPKRR